MQFPAVMLRGDLDGADDLEAGAGRGLAGPGQGGERVVVGDGDGGQARPGRQADHLLGSVSAVAAGGVQMQVGPVPQGALRQGLAKTGERLAGRHGSGRLREVAEQAVEDAVDKRR